MPRAGPGQGHGRIRCPLRGGATGKTPYQDLQRLPCLCGRQTRQSLHHAKQCHGATAPRYWLSPKSRGCTHETFFCFPSGGSARAKDTAPASGLDREVLPVGRVGNKARERALLRTLYIMGKRKETEDMANTFSIKKTKRERRMTYSGDLKEVIKRAKKELKEKQESPKRQYLEWKYKEAKKEHERWEERIKDLRDFISIAEERVEKEEKSQ